jgi:hypothetical protein
MMYCVFVFSFFCILVNYAIEVRSPLESDPTAARRLLETKALFKTAFAYADPNFAVELLVVPSSWALVFEL